MRTKKVAVVITKDLAVALPQGLPVEALPGGDYEVVALDEISGVPADVMEA